MTTEPTADFYVQNAPRYRVGDPDPTPDGNDPCGARDPNGVGVCTWPRGHQHPQHVAGTGDHVGAVWDVEKPEASEDETPAFSLTPAPTFSARINELPGHDAGPFVEVRVWAGSWPGSRGSAGGLTMRRAEAERFVRVLDNDAESALRSAAWAQVGPPDRDDPEVVERARDLHDAEPHDADACNSVMVGVWSQAQASVHYDRAQRLVEHWRSL